MLPAVLALQPHRRSARAPDLDTLVRAAYAFRRRVASRRRGGDGGGGGLDDAAAGRVAASVEDGLGFPAHFWCWFYVTWSGLGGVSWTEGLMVLWLVLFDCSGLLTD